MPGIQGIGGNGMEIYSGKRNLILRLGIWMMGLVFFVTLITGNHFLGEVFAQTKESADSV
jgi:hypothetical protein